MPDQHQSIATRPDLPHQVAEAFGGVARCNSAYDMLWCEMSFASKREPDHESLAILSIQGAGDLTFCMIPDRTHRHKLEIQLRRVLIQVADFESGWILAHNHPTRSAAPSESDYHTTMVMAFLGNLLERPMIDHWIFGQESFYSFALEDPGRLHPIVTLRPDPAHDPRIDGL